MNYQQILDKIRTYFNMPTKTPKCFSDGEFLYCWCGKCKQKDYELPKDFNEMVAQSAANYYKKIQGK